MRWNTAHERITLWNDKSRRLRQMVGIKTFGGFVAAQE
jgi:hypothetical protein